jgi:hypothetical protein
MLTENLLLGGSESCGGGTLKTVGRAMKEI